MSSIATLSRHLLYESAIWTVISGLEPLETYELVLNTLRNEKKRIDLQLQEFDKKTIKENFRRNIDKIPDEALDGAIRQRVLDKEWMCIQQISLCPSLIVKVETIIHGILIQVDVDSLPTVLTLLTSPLKIPPDHLGDAIAGRIFYGPKELKDRGTLVKAVIDSGRPINMSSERLGRILRSASLELAPSILRIPIEVPSKDIERFLFQHINWLIYF
jgi:hypothetical protein